MIRSSRISYHLNRHPRFRTLCRRQLAAATSSQKRALNKDQLEGSDAASVPKKVDPPVGTTAAQQSTSGSAFPFLVVGGGAVAAGAAYYYWWSQQQQQYEAAPVSASSKAATTSIGNSDKKSQPSAESKAVTKSLTDNSTKVATSDPSSSENGNRVTSIQLPAKMKNASSSTAGSSVVLQHPVGGNRVTTLLPSTSEKKATTASASLQDTTMTENAIQKLKSSKTDEAAAALIQSHQSTWSEMDKTYFADLDQLTNTQLKARVVQLATEMKDRTKWEAVRLKEFLAMKEKETADQYMDAMQKQRLEFEDLLAKRIREQETALSSQMNEALANKEATIQTVLKTALEAQQNEHEADKKAFEELLKAELQVKLEAEYSEQLLQVKTDMANQVQEKALTVEKLSQRLKQLEEALNVSQANQQGSAKAHRLSAAALALSEKLETSKSAASELESLKTAAGKDGVIVTAVKTIPESVARGVPTLAELQARFERSYKKFRQAALVPEGRPELEGQLAGIVFAAFKYPPAPGEAAPEDDKDNAEYVLVRAQGYIQEGDLERAVEQLDKLKGQVAFSVSDWKKDAIDRIMVERALKVIKMECALLNEKLAE